MSAQPVENGGAPRRLRRDAAANRERILAAAAIAVSREGERVPMARIAEEAGVGIGTLYRRYPTRAALLAALTMRSFELVLGHARSAAASGGPAPSALAEFFDRTIAARDDLILPLHGGPVIDDTRVVAVQAEIRSLLEQLLARGRRDRTVRPDATPIDIITGATLAQPLPHLPDWDSVRSPASEDLRRGPRCQSPAPALLAGRHNKPSRLNGGTSFFEAAGLLGRRAVAFPPMAAPQSFLVLHGLANHRPPEHWQFWISAQLAADGHQVLYPGLPDPDTPSFADWAGTLHQQLDAMRGPQRTVICHSLSCLLWLAVAGDIRADRRPSRLLLVSPPDPHHVPEAGGEIVRPFSPAAAAASATDELRVVCSDADPYNPTGAVQMYSEPLGCPVDVLPGAGHITPGDGYGAWPSLEAWCHKRASAVAGASQAQRVQRIA